MYELAKQILEQTDGKICKNCLGRKLSKTIEGKNNIERADKVCEELDINLDDVDCVICDNIFDKLNDDLYKKIDFYTNKGCKTMSAAKNKSGEYGGTAEMFRTMKPKFYVPIYQWHGGKNCFDACVIQDKNKIDKGCSYFKFDSAQEQINFIDSLHTKFMNWFYYSFIVPGDYKEQAYLFRMTDYSKPWDDKRFCEYFGITGYISDTEAEPNSEWETILNTMKEHK